MPRKRGGIGYRPMATIAGRMPLVGAWTSWIAYGPHTRTASSTAVSGSATGPSARSWLTPEHHPNRRAQRVAETSSCLSQAAGYGPARDDRRLLAAGLSHRPTAATPAGRTQRSLAARRRTGSAPISRLFRSRRRQPFLSGDRLGRHSDRFRLEFRTSSQAATGCRDPPNGLVARTTRSTAAGRRAENRPPDARPWAPTRPHPRSFRSAWSEQLGVRLASASIPLPSETASGVLIRADPPEGRRLHKAAHHPRHRLARVDGYLRMDESRRHPERPRRVSRSAADRGRQS